MFDFLISVYASYLQFCNLRIFKMGCCNAHKYDLENLKVFSHDEIVKQQIEEYPLLVYGKSNSASLQQIKDALHKQDIQFEAFELNLMHEGNEI